MQITKHSVQSGITRGEIRGTWIYKYASEALIQSYSVVEGRIASGEYDWKGYLARDGLRVRLGSSEPFYAEAVLEGNKVITLERRPLHCKQLHLSQPSPVHQVHQKRAWSVR